MKMYLPIWFYIGVLIIVSLIIGIVFRVDFFLNWATPVFWTGYILVVDGVVYSFKGKSFVFYIGFPIVFLLSIFVWWFFEWTNIFLSNWHYHNLPDLLTRYIGYFWSFGTIIPAILLTYSLVLVMTRDVKIEFHRFQVTNIMLGAMILLGLFFLLLPIVPFSMKYLDRSADPELFFWLKWLGDIKYSEYMAFAVWLSVFLILDPINYLMKKPSILGSIEKGNYKVILALSVAGIVCGVFWELVNWFAVIRWTYNVPILPQVKIFEMPILGYLGFIAFAWEIYDIVSFVFRSGIVRVQEWFV